MQSKVGLDTLAQQQPNDGLGHIIIRSRIGGDDSIAGAFELGLFGPETNRIAIDVDDLPMDAAFAQEEILVRPPARSGVVARFDVVRGWTGEAVAVDALGAPLPVGAILVSERDRRRFPVGRSGRVYLSGIENDEVLTLEGSETCRIRVAPSTLAVDTLLQCEPRIAA